MLPSEAAAMLIPESEDRLLLKYFNISDLLVGLIEEKVLLAAVVKLAVSEKLVLIEFLDSIFVAKLVRFSVSYDPGPGDN